MGNQAVSRSEKEENSKDLVVGSEEAAFGIPALWEVERDGASKNEISEMAAYTYVNSLDVDNANYRVIPSIVNEKETDEINCSLAYSFLKRTIDIVISIVVLVIACIPMAIIAIIIRIDSAGPSVYSQERLGLNGKPFKIYKFRSMYRDAEIDGAQWAEKDDKRVTRVGRFI